MVTNNKMIRTLYEASRNVARLKVEEEIKETPESEIKLYESNIVQIKNFINSKVWLDMSNALGEMMEQLQLSMMIENDPDQIRRLQGTATALLFLAELPESMLDELITDEQIQKEEEEEEDVDE